MAIIANGPLRAVGQTLEVKGRTLANVQVATFSDVAPGQPGDYIVDTYRLTAGGGAFPSGKYEVWTGFFTGSNPNWKNMSVSEAPAEMRDTADRVKITTITLD